jgi:hypothetical protein
LKTLKVQTLDIDLYFNNITEVGTQVLSESIGGIETLEQLSLNLDFNYIKNEGAKDVGDMLKKLPKL